MGSLSWSHCASGKPLDPPHFSLTGFQPATCGEISDLRLGDQLLSTVWRVEEAKHILRVMAPTTSCLNREKPRLPPIRLLVAAN